ncbi:ribulokinase [Rhodophyticola sp. CCM32]|uniref:FGGY family pentulose kinase n=1 Tax=Rhodophyticola sp. CCM32 TaxID=2916397 RepID=UPI00107F5C92|nr:FGGY family pentulose kinase [Rhodophyticola sp. CCM32]QBX99940.1 ribulokinase [Rhodophyticola sp. CCM32]
MSYVLGIDVGSGSARCGVFDVTGRLCGTAKADILIHRPAPGFVEQSSADIWQAVCRATRAATRAADVPPEAILSLSYSATCSLVLLDRDHEPLALNAGDPPWDIIMWMDHRATAETDICNRTASPVLRNLGGAMSVEMQIPKLMWLNRNRPDLWARLGYAGDLADFLVFKSTGSLARSICTLGCKWTYDADAGQWTPGFLEQVGLSDLRERAALPAQAAPIGGLAGSLDPAAAAEMGLTPACQVAVGLIDAHAGALGTAGLYADDALNTRLALIAGTSNCHIALTDQRVEVPGVWGPYHGAVLDGAWALEGGQSASGAMLDQILDLFAASQAYGETPHDALARELLERMKTQPDIAGDIVVTPDFLGNRSPFADPGLRGSISGLTLEDPAESFCKIYWAACLSIAYGTRQIIGAMRGAGLPIRTIHLSGGHARSDLLVRLYADATGCDVLLPGTAEPVLLGAALAAATPLGAAFPLGQAKALRETVAVQPDPAVQTMHARRYKAFCQHYASAKPGQP